MVFNCAGHASDAGESADFWRVSGARRLFSAVVWGGFLSAGRIDDDQWRDAFDGFYLKEWTGSGGFYDDVERTGHGGTDSLDINRDGSSVVRGRSDFFAFMALADNTDQYDISELAWDWTCASDDWICIFSVLGNRAGANYTERKFYQRAGWGGECRATDSIYASICGTRAVDLDYRIAGIVHWRLYWGTKGGRDPGNGGDRSNGEKGLFGYGGRMDQRDVCGADNQPIHSDAAAAFDRVE